MNYELLRRVMERRGVSQKEMAIYSKIGLGTLKKKMRGETEFTLSEINRISELLGFEKCEVELIFFT